MPAKLTPHENGLKSWSFADFDKLMRQGVRKDGRPLDPLMPVSATRNFNGTEMKALWAYLQQVPAKDFGRR